ncbi:glycoside hydrolase family 27 protein [Actinoalloteichus hymeniacidonis]|uniref:Alpha-galactosidase n=1 Tax=Actinoalloteichus hymeniacidonis TaxID=340345 RepID=A0AAC9MZT7_9PSEU|nr:glycoside hydrolase family 27 protein [Actinoalloteichus hymeniacidonis]AOS64276.1 hypothetical protein TL08_17380 [Actinoalloteichus hymeniacidonis]MBB5907656.1 hypothetical protein [Actinoalloteichus hymeniacidonis]
MGTPPENDPAGEPDSSTARRGRSASTPPMGWNSWDCYGGSVREAEVLANARYLRDHLLPHGWDHVVVDIQWYEPTADTAGYHEGAVLDLDANGRPMPSVNRFPSAADGAGFAPLAARIHEMGLRFGLHILRGIPRQAVAQRLPILGTDWTAADVADHDHVCPWNPDNLGLDHEHPGAQAYYDSLLARFAEWGVDYVKADDMLAPYHAAEIAAFSRAIEASGRPMVLSLSPGTDLGLEHLDHLVQHSDVWRISDDLWDRWPLVYDQFERMARWAPHAGQGRWPDADMLPLGRIGIRAHGGDDRRSRLTRDEQRSLMALWAMARSPLMFGGDLPSNDDWTLGLLTNDALLAITKDSVDNRQHRREGELVVWTASSGDGRIRYVAQFNLGDVPADSTVQAAELGTDADDLVVDILGSGTPVRLGVSRRTPLPPHGCVLWAISSS